MKPSQIEQTKLLATALNNVATACVTVGVATPLAAIIYNIGGLRGAVESWIFASGFAAYLGAAVALHLTARSILRGLDQ